jgi:tryptophan synthase alpha chain
LRAKTELPVAVGFGIKTPAQAANVARIADAAVVGSALVQTIADSLDDAGHAGKETAAKALIFVRALAAGVQSARDAKPARAAVRT